MQEYDDWLKDQTPKRMAKVLEALDPVITSEASRYQGPVPLMRTRAKVIAADAVRTYDPASGAKLRSWVTTNMQQLSRYSNRMRPIRIPEEGGRRAAELARRTAELTEETGRQPTDEELADDIGVSPKRIAKLREMVPAFVSEGSLGDTTDDAENSTLPAISQSNQAAAGADVVRASLDERDGMIYDLKTGGLSNMAIAARLGVSPAFVSQRSADIAKRVAAAAVRL